MRYFLFSGRPLPGNPVVRLQVSWRHEYESAAKSKAMAVTFIDDNPLMPSYCTENSTKEPTLEQGPRAFQSHHRNHDYKTSARATRVFYPYREKPGISHQA